MRAARWSARERAFIRESLAYHLESDDAATEGCKSVKFQAQSKMKALPALLFILTVGTAQAATITAATGNASDVQSAINSAKSGDTIIIPNGTYAWNQAVTNSNNICVHIQAQSLGGVTINRVYNSGNMLSLNGSPNGNVELSGIHFIDPGDTSTNNSTFTVNVNQLSGQPVLIHDCSFVTGFCYGLQFVGNGGVVWNCSFATTSDQLGGITFVNTSTTNSFWNQPTSMGLSGDPNGTLNTYIENNYFGPASVVMCNFDDNSRIVWRDNTMDNAAMQCHGQETSIWGSRHWEIYDNTFVYSTSGTAFGGDSYPIQLNTWFNMRGGTGVFTGNSVPAIGFGKNQLTMSIYSIYQSDSIPCQDGYPAAHQVGQSWSASSTQTFGSPVVTKDGTGAITDPIYIWGNTGTATTNSAWIVLNALTDQCGDGQNIANYVQEGRDYITSSGRPGWTRFTFPHPLRANAVSAVGSSPLPLLAQVRHLPLRARPRRRLLLGLLKT